MDICRSFTFFKKIDEKYFYILSHNSKKKVLLKETNMQKSIHKFNLDELYYEKVILLRQTVNFYLIILLSFPKFNQLQIYLTTIY